jgi:hypothetical protein
MVASSKADGRKKEERGKTTEGHKDHMSKRKAQNAKRKTQNTKTAPHSPTPYFFIFFYN